MTATLEAGASITPGTIVDFNATGNVDSEAEAKSSNTNNGTVGIAISLEFSNANVTTTVAGNVSATAGPGSNMVLAFDPSADRPERDRLRRRRHRPGQPHTIYVGPNSFQTGDPVTYRTAAATASAARSRGSSTARPTT